MPEPKDIPWLYGAGIRRLLSAVSPARELEERFEVVSVPMGSTFRHAGKILEHTWEIPPRQILIHCQHGADRTGCILAFLLCVKHEWNIADAFYSVLYKSPRDCSALAELLKGLDIQGTRYSDDPSVGFYGLAACGLPGGLKARSKNYQKLILSTIEKIKEERNKP